ncbi:MAG: polymer-forming cytoskeletal protein [Candidatus Hydrogenedentes bacterium]|nr:polymer-forming cytoskeletal protein [Candidatus Hydrogenedentota bacterium]
MSKEESKESKGILGKLFKRLDESLETSRSKIVSENTSKQERDTISASLVGSPEKLSSTTTTTSTSRETKIDKTQKIGVSRMVIPEGVFIKGSISGECDAQIYGIVDGDITIKGKLELGPSARVKGLIKAISSSINGTVEGNIECNEDVEIGQNSKVTADIIAGQRVMISGIVKGNIKAGALVKLLSTAKVEGDVTVVKSFSIDENAVFNGKCIMGKIEDIKTVTNESIKSPTSVSSQQVKK